MAELSSIADIIMGQSPPSSSYNESREGLPFFQGKADFGFRNPEVRLFCNAPLKIARPNDILMSVRAPVGPTNVADRECCIGRGLAAIRAKDIESDFLYFNLRYIEKFIASLGSGSTFHAINKAQLASVEVNPHDFSRNEQRKIAAMLNFVQRAIEQQEQLTGLIRELKKAFHHQLFTQGLRGENQKQTDIGPVPESWKVMKLGELLQIKHGFAFLGEFFRPAGRYILLTPGHFYESGGFRNQGEKTKFYTGDFPRGYLLQKGDLLVVMTEQKDGLLGSSVVVPEGERYLHNQRLGLIENLDEARLSKEFLYYLFNTPAVRKRISMTASGSKVRHTSPSKIRDVWIALPSLDEQHEVVQILKAVDRKLSVTVRKHAILNNLFRTLLHQLMTAQIRVHELDLPELESAAAA